MRNEKIKQDQEKLLLYILGVCELLLKKNGQFYPVAASLDYDEETAPVATDDGNSHPESLKVIADLKVALNSRYEAKKIIAAVIAYEMLVVDPRDNVKKDAILVLIDHKESVPIALFYPYEPKKNGIIFYDQMFGAKEYEKIFEK